MLSAKGRLFTLGLNELKEDYGESMISIGVPFPWISKDFNVEYICLYIWIS